jgi:hypothetical protein
MRIYGLDFTSAPSRKKPITCAEGWFENNKLQVSQILRLTDFEHFEALLVKLGPWFMAIDFPFSLPREWIEAMGWPLPWGDYVKRVGEMSLEEFVGHVRAYRERQPAGKKYHFRPVDRLARSRSPMMVDYTPVGRMFYQGAPRLLRSGACIPMLNTRRSDRYIVEGYPALVARRFVEKQGYKSDTPKKQTAAKALARQRIVDGLLNGQIEQEFGFEIDLRGITIAELVAEPGADMLDAILCAIQAAWSCSRQHMDYGLPEVSGIGVPDGWIPDPGLLPKDYDFYANLGLSSP